MCKSVFSRGGQIQPCARLSCNSQMPGLTGLNRNLNPWSKNHFWLFLNFLNAVSCVVDADTDYPGLDLNLGTGRTSDRRNSALECRALCNANQDCNYFGWKAQSRECWMKTGISRKVKESGTTSGPACRKGRQACLIYTDLPWFTQIYSDLPWFILI